MKIKSPRMASSSKHAQDQLFTAISKIKSTAEAKAFLNDLCTPNELQAMADRWIVVAHVKAGKSYREIHRETGVSLTTIGRVARCLSFGTHGYDIIYKRLMKGSTKA